MPKRQNLLKTEFLRLVIDARARCGLPPVQPGRDQSAFVPPAWTGGCVRQLYDGQRNRWAGRLSGAAAEEAVRPPDENVNLQTRLRDLGLLPREATADGVFGTATRSAITAWQLAKGRPGTGLLGDVDAALLLLRNAATVQATPKDPWAEVTVDPLAAIDYHGRQLCGGVGWGLEGDARQLRPAATPACAAPVRVRCSPRFPRRSREPQGAR